MITNRTIYISKNNKKAHEFLERIKRDKEIHMKEIERTPKMTREEFNRLLAEQNYGELEKEKVKFDYRN